MAVDDYLDADNAVRTEEALLDEEIVRGLMHANEENETEPEDAPIAVVDYAAAYKAFTTLSQWYDLHSLPISSLHEVEQEMLDFRFRSLRKMPIDQYLLAPNSALASSNVDITACTTAKEPRDDTRCCVC